jgi:hypothetical protein
VCRLRTQPVLPSIQVSEANRKEKLTVAEFKASLTEALKPPSKGVVFWNWEALEKDPEKSSIVESLVRQLNRP